MRFLLAPLLLGIFIGPSAAEDPKGAVIDSEKRFRPATIDRADQIIQDIHDRYGFEVRVETIRSAPGVDPTWMSSVWSGAQGKALKKAARQRAEELGFSGLFVLITSQPRCVTVIAHPEAREKESYLSRAKREKIRSTLTNRLPRDGDGALIRALEQYRLDLGEPARSSPLQTLPALLVALGLMGFWITLWLFRRRAARPESPRPIYPPAMMGSLFGVPAGFWIYDRLFQAERPVATAAGSESALETLFTSKPALIDEYHSSMTGSEPRE
ncbi:MAG: hypothetical protein ACKO23_04965 [Gemmataceae bacterium]